MAKEQEKQHRAHFEFELYSIGKWAIWSMQLICYLPMTFVKGHGFRFRFRNCTLIRGILISIGSLLWNLNFFHKRRDFARLTKIYGETELFAQTLLVLVISFTGIFTRLTSFVRVRSTIEFWKENARTFERIVSSHGMTTAFLCQGSHAHLFTRIQRDLRTYALCYFVPAILHFVLHIYIVIDASSHKNWTVEIEISIGAGFWTWLAFFHVSYSLWILFYIKLYTAAFKIIESNVTELLDQSEAFNTKSQQKLDPVIYIGEICQMTLGKDNTLGIRIRNCIEMFQLIEKQIKSFNTFFAAQLIMEMLDCIVGILGFSFFTILWVGRGLPQSALPLVIPLFIFTLEVYRLGTEAGRLTQTALKVLKKIQLLPLHRLSLELQLKVQLFTTSAWTNPPIITAGHFFNVNRQMITSISSAMTTFLIVLVQFKETDDSSTESGAGDDVGSTRWPVGQSNRSWWCRWSFNTSTIPSSNILE